MGYCLNCLDEPIFMAVPKPMLTEFGIHYRLESCASFMETGRNFVYDDIKNHILRGSREDCREHKSVPQRRRISKIIDWWCTNMTALARQHHHAGMGDRNM